METGFCLSQRQALQVETGFFFSKEACVVEPRGKSKGPKKARGKALEKETYI